MKLLGLKHDQVTASIVINAYFQCGHVDDARRMFSEIPRNDEICWTKIIVGYVQNGREEDALMLFGDMLHRDVRPDSYTISSVVSSCAILASLCHAQVVDGKVIVIGVDHSMLVSSALVDMYCKCGVTLDAWRILGTMSIRNKNVKPNSISFVGILSACISADMVAKGREYFNSISEHGMTPTLDHYACMVTLIGRSSGVDKAMDLIKCITHEPDYLIWSTLFSICGKKGDI
ncbi:hypothetical protein HN51_043873 [Arachis hypogaea]|uniref:putative pentatricopeptide repeat-containing protein At1g68930 n=1 Tax=Arachis hypogaea TaxID=3818 RepID=UPI000DEDC158|nr:putative pentatricopeptide repeat-containing protein At1g68930 [Arachis hypogaea]